MNKLENRAFRKLEIRIEELERHFKISQNQYIDTFTALYSTRVAMREAYEAICDAKRALEIEMAADPVFMQLRAEIAHDF